MSLPFKRQLEIAWAAGFFDGEGHVRVSKRSTYRTVSGEHRTYNHNCAPVIQLAQNEKSLLTRFNKSVDGKGRISGPYQTKGTNNVHWRLTVHREADVISIMELLWPHLSKPKRDQWRKVQADIRLARKTWNVTITV